MPISTRRVSDWEEDVNDTLVLARWLKVLPLQGVFHACYVKITIAPCASVEPLLMINKFATLTMKHLKSLGLQALSDKSLFSPQKEFAMFAARTTTIGEMFRQ